MGKVLESVRYLGVHIAVEPAEVEQPSLLTQDFSDEDFNDARARPFQPSVFPLECHGADGKRQ